MLVQLQKLSNSLKAGLNEIWKDLCLVIKNFREVPIDEVNHYQILVLKNLVDEKYSDQAKFEQLDAQIEADLIKHGELNRQLQSAQILEELSIRNAIGGGGDQQPAS